VESGALAKPGAGGERRSGRARGKIELGQDVDDVKQLFLEFQAAGVPFHQTLRKEPWGATTFIVRDPDGNLLLFA